MKRIPKVKYMTEEQLKRIIANNYQGDPSEGYGYDYGADLKDEIDQRLWELQAKKQETRKRNGRLFKRNGINAGRLGSGSVLRG